MKTSVNNLHFNLTEILIKKNKQTRSAGAVMTQIN